jgi:hypothetical protein
MPSSRTPQAIRDREQNVALNSLSLRERAGGEGLQIYPKWALTPHPRLPRDLSLREG